ncbi:MAG: beta-galactosidase GalB [Planctomycetota bacterium]
MKSIILATLVGAFCVSAAIAETVTLRQRISINADWRFQKGDPSEVGGKLAYDKIKNWVLPSGAAFAKDPAQQWKRPEGNLGGDISYVKAAFDDKDWRKLDLPHDWAIEGAFDKRGYGQTGKRTYWGAVYYRKHLEIPASDQGRQFYLDIDGAMSYSLVWCNGQFVGGWPYGYSSFRLDLTPYIKAGGDNVLTIRLNSPVGKGPWYNGMARWYPGAGLYRNVWLVKTGPVHVGHWGTYITTPEVTPESALVKIGVTLANSGKVPARVVVKTQILDGPTCVATTASHTVSVDPGTRANTTVQVAVEKPKLWDTVHPDRYTAVTILESDGNIIDRYETVFGIRTIKFTANEGFLLNGKRVRINGVCNHHDLGALGAAFNTRAAERQLEILKEMGVNALRTSHNMPAPELVDLCDRMGILVMDESFDCWEVGKTAFDYNKLYPDWHEKDLRALCRRDRNHPSVILWSIGNEVNELRDNVYGPKMAASLSAICHEEDPTRPTIIGSNHGGASYNGVQKGVDVFGQNYEAGGYAEFRKRNPTIPLLGSETSSCVSSRGEYQIPLQGKNKGNVGDHQVTSYDLAAPPWGRTPDDEFRAQDQNPFVAGEFVWTGFDYLGEPHPYMEDARSSYFGIVDLAGFKKDRFYSYQAHWRPELPMAHIFPHWNWTDAGSIIPVHVYTSGDAAELFLNGKSLGKKMKKPFEYRLRWDDVKYQPGEIKVVATKDGKPWAEDVVQTTGPAAKVLLKADRAKIAGDGLDLSFVTVTLADSSGRKVPRAKNLVRFEVSGPAEIVAVDNGDAYNFDAFQAKEAKAFNGLALVILRGKLGQVGTVTLRALSEGLTSAEVTLETGPR